MKNICNNCGKSKENIDSFGYCRKCSSKIFKEGKHTTVKQIKFRKKKNFMILLLFIIAIAVLIFFYKDNIFKFTSSLTSTNSSSSNTKNNSFSEKVQSILPIENQTLTEENINSLIEEFGSKNKDDDKYYYLSYAVFYHIFKDGISTSLNASLNNATDEEIEKASYKSMYGKTINQLISEGKQLMKENNVTIEDYKKSLEDLNNMNTNFEN